LSCHLVSTEAVNSKVYHQTAHTPYHWQSQLEFQALVVLDGVNALAFGPLATPTFSRKFSAQINHDETAISPTKTLVMLAKRLTKWMSMEVVPYCRPQM
jgi:hypothetical protein